MQVDLFITTPEQFGLILLIRTGPADYSQWLVTEAKRRRHHVAGGWLRAGGRCPAAEGLRQSCACPAIPTPTEESVYAALGLPFVPPEARTA
jgi:DNA polymerase/3'-5' exonuclease PolX